MDSNLERRARTRVLAGPDVAVQFTARESTFRDVRITNLSQGGCFATLPRPRGELFRQGLRLQGFRFQNPDLEGLPLEAEVAYVLGGGGGGRGGMELVGLGIHFLAMAPSMTEALRMYVEGRI